MEQSKSWKIIYSVKLSLQLYPQTVRTFKNNAYPHEQGNGYRSLEKFQITTGKFMENLNSPWSPLLNCYIMSETYQEPNKSTKLTKSTYKSLLGEMYVTIAPVFLSLALSVLEFSKGQQPIEKSRCYFGRKLPAVLPQLQDKSNYRKKKTR